MRRNPVDDKPSLSVNVEAARRAHEERYRLERQARYALELAVDFHEGVLTEEELRAQLQDELQEGGGLTPDEFKAKYLERLNIPLPCGCLHPIERLDKYEEEGWREEATCEHGTWVVERKGGIRVGEKDRASRWASSGPLSDRS